MCRTFSSEATPLAHFALSLPLFLSPVLFSLSRTRHLIFFYIFFFSSSGVRYRWVHVAGIYVVTVVCLLFLNSEFSNYIKVRQRYLQQRKPHMRTIMLDVPADARSNAILESYFGYLYPDAVLTAVCTQVCVCVWRFYVGDRKGWVFIFQHKQPANTTMYLPTGLSTVSRGFFLFVTTA